MCIFLSVGVSQAGIPAVPAFWQTVSWLTSDGVRLVGSFHPPTPGHRTWVLLHGLGSSRGEWDAFGKRLAEQGNGILAYDARGHNESVTRNGQALDYRSFSPGPGSQWEQMVADLGTAVQFLQTHFSLREDAIAVGGASLGANVALLYAAAHPKVPALILLSPGINYAGIETEKPFRRYAKRPVFIAASPQDTMAFASVRRLLLQRTDSACRAAEGDGAAHGVKMFQNEAFTRKLLDWIKDTEASSKQQASEQGNSCRPSLAGSLLAAR